MGGGATAGGDFTANSQAVKGTGANVVTAFMSPTVGVAPGTYCLTVTNPTAPNSGILYYDSDAGGLRPLGTIACSETASIGGTMNRRVGGSPPHGFRYPGGAHADVWEVEVRVAADRAVERVFGNGVSALVDRCEFLAGKTTKKGESVEYRYKVVLRSGVTPLKLLAELSKHEDTQGVEIKQL